jgi:MoaA/NifB/PqqE/SkfB family radical SAM enzyme
MSKTILQGLWENCLTKKPLKGYVNFLISNFERKNIRSKIISKPYLLYVDPTSFCNLRCPFCETVMQTDSREKKQLLVEDFDHILEHIGEYLFEISFFNWGEPLLNHNLPKMVKHAKQYDIFTKISTNMSINMTPIRSRVGGIWSRSDVLLY